MPMQVAFGNRWRLRWELTAQLYPPELVQPYLDPKDCVNWVCLLLCVRVCACVLLLVRMRICVYVLFVSA